MINVPCIPTGPDDNCNGIDEDCIGGADDKYVPITTSCGLGECAATGQTTCSGGAEGDTCTLGAPSAEVCDNLDNDCDGLTDPGDSDCQKVLVDLDIAHFRVSRNVSPVKDSARRQKPFSVI